MNGRGKNKARGKRRTHKVSKGINSNSHHPLTEQEKALLGKGRVQAIRHVPCKSNYKGTPFFDEPFDKAQVDINKELYPHLFND